MADAPPQGTRYDLTYIERGAEALDNPRLRRRLATYIDTELDDCRYDLGMLLRREIGIHIRSGSESGNATQFLIDAPLAEFLGGITVIFHALVLREKRDRFSSNRISGGWRDFVERAFRECNVAFTVDHQGGVHPRIDTHFVAEQVAGLKDLSRPRYAAARECFVRAYNALDGAPPATATAIWELFVATETVFKLAVGPSAKSLGTAELARFLRPRVQAIYVNADLNAANRMLSAASDWAESAHQYRHGQGIEEPSPPPLDFTVFVMSMGTAFLRWLIALDQRLLAASVANPSPSEIGET